jgi:hypothetical protein
VNPPRKSVMSRVPLAVLVLLLGCAFLYLVYVAIK